MVVILSSCKPRAYSGNLVRRALLLRFSFIVNELSANTLFQAASALANLPSRPRSNAVLTCRICLEWRLASSSFKPVFRHLAKSCSKLLAALPDRPEADPLGLTRGYQHPVVGLGLASCEEFGVGVHWPAPARLSCSVAVT